MFSVHFYINEFVLNSSDCNRLESATKRGALARCQVKFIRSTRCHGNRNCTLPACTGCRSEPETNPDWKTKLKSSSRWMEVGRCPPFSTGCFSCWISPLCFKYCPRWFHTLKHSGRINRYRLDWIHSGALQSGRCFVCCAFGHFASGAASNLKWGLPESSWLCCFRNLLGFLKPFWAALQSLFDVFSENVEQIAAYFRHWQLGVHQLTNGMWTESTPIPNSLQESRKNLERILLNWILIEWMVEMMVNESNGLGFVVQIGNWWCTESSWGSSGCCCGSCGWWPTSTASFTRLRFIRSTCCGVLGSSAKSSTAAPESFSRGAPFSVLRPLVHSFIIIDLSAQLKCCDWFRWQIPAGFHELLPRLPPHFNVQRAAAVDYRPRGW